MAALLYMEDNISSWVLQLGSGVAKGSLGIKPSMGGFNPQTS